MTSRLQCIAFKFRISLTTVVLAYFTAIWEEELGHRDWQGPDLLSDQVGRLFRTYFECRHHSVKQFLVGTSLHKLHSMNCIGLALASSQHQYRTEQTNIAFTYTRGGGVLLP